MRGMIDQVGKLRCAKCNHILAGGLLSSSHDATIEIECKHHGCHVYNVFAEVDSVVKPLYPVGVKR